jgi:hypothetical protein
MADSVPDPSPDADAPPAGSSEPPDWGRLLDAAGIIAGILLIVIVADIWTDGRLISRRLRGGDDDIPAG